jgi:hypothetical protein
VKLCVGDPVRHCGEISDKLFMRYVGRVVEVQGDKAIVQHDGKQRIFNVENLALGITAGRVHQFPMKEKHRGVWVS